MKNPSYNFESFNVPILEKEILNYCVPKILNKYYSPLPVNISDFPGNSRARSMPEHQEIHR
jgi:hypothetical protein